MNSTIMQSYTPPDAQAIHMPTVQPFHPGGIDIYGAAYGDIEDIAKTAGMGALTIGGTIAAAVAGAIAGLTFATVTRKSGTSAESAEKRQRQMVVTGAGAAMILGLMGFGMLGSMMRGQPVRRRAKRKAKVPSVVASMAAKGKGAVKG